MRHGDPGVLCIAQAFTKGLAVALRQWGVWRGKTSPAASQMFALAMARHENPCRSVSNLAGSVRVSRQLQTRPCGLRCFLGRGHVQV